MFIISYYKRRRWHSAQGSLADKMQAAGGVSVQQNSRGNKLARHTKICVACLMIVDASTQNIIRRPQIFVLLDVVFFVLACCRIVVENVYLSQATARKNMWPCTRVVISVVMYEFIMSLQYCFCRRIFLGFTSLTTD